MPQQTNVCDLFKQSACCQSASASANIQSSTDNTESILNRNQSEVQYSAHEQEDTDNVNSWAMIGFELQVRIS